MDECSRSQKDREDVVDERPSKVECTPEHGCVGQVDECQDDNLRRAHEDNVGSALRDVGALVHVHANGGVRERDSVVGSIAAEYGDLPVFGEFLHKL